MKLVVAIFVLVFGDFHRIYCQKDYKIHITKAKFERCPHVSNTKPVVDFKSTVIYAKSLSKKGGTFRLIGGEVRKIKGDLQFPDCFRITVKTKFNRSIKNPYLELFLNFGGFPICKKYSSNTYCPSSKNDQLRNSAVATSACRFCNLCVEAKKLTSKSDNVRKNLDDILHHSRGTLEEICEQNSIKADQLYQLNVGKFCTPSVSDFELALNRTLGPSWPTFKKYQLSQSAFLATIHILNRSKETPKECLEFGADTFDWTKIGSKLLRSLIEAQLRKKCSEFEENVHNDQYLDCYYGFVEYDIKY